MSDTALHSARRRERLAKAQDGICPECTLPLPEDLTRTEVDHIIPKVRGGPDVAWNRQLVHFKCNRTKRYKLTARAAELATEHGVTVHLPIFAAAHANRPITLEESRRQDYWKAFFGLSDTPATAEQPDPGPAAQ